MILAHPFGRDDQCGGSVYAAVIIIKIIFTSSY